jgi:pyruvate,water dikinase
VRLELTGIHWLGDDDCHREAIVGGKAASLSRLAALHTVPHGFAIPAVPALADAVPGPLVPSIEAAYHALGEHCGSAPLPVAVRSSAIDEDGSDSSFAGQHDTYLNIRGAEAVVHAVLRCARSAASHEALAYRTARGLSVEDVRIAVLVQQLVASDVSAVAFSANPVTGSRDEVMINANWGLGESIVGGMATPDTFVVSKSARAVTASDIACKTVMTVMTETGTEDADVPAAIRTQPSLEDAQVMAIAELATRLERDLGFAVDIECAFARGQLFLLQCRPITTLG